VSSPPTTRWTCVPKGRFIITCELMNSSQFLCVVPAVVILLLTLTTLRLCRRGLSRGPVGVRTFEMRVNQVGALNGGSARGVDVLCLPFSHASRMFIFLLTLFVVFVRPIYHTLTGQQPPPAHKIAVKGCSWSQIVSRPAAAFTILNCDEKNRQVPATLPIPPLLFCGPRHASHALQIVVILKFWLLNALVISTGVRVCARHSQS
jgi:hypothetical protein